MVARAVATDTFQGYVMGLTEKQLGGWSLLLGTAAVTVGYALSPGRGVVDNVPSNSLTDLTLAMARNPGFAYTVPVVIILGALLMLHGLLTLRRHAAPVPRLGLMAMAIALVLQMVMRGLDYMITGMGEAALESDGVRSEEWLQSALEMQRLVFGLHFSSSVAGFAGMAVLALGHAPSSRAPRTCHGAADCHSRILSFRKNLSATASSMSMSNRVARAASRTNASAISSLSWLRLKSP